MRTKNPESHLARRRHDEPNPPAVPRAIAPRPIAPAEQDRAIYIHPSTVPPHLTNLKLLANLSDFGLALLCTGSVAWCSHASRTSDRKPAWEVHFGLHHGLFQCPGTVEAFLDPFRYLRS